MTVGPTDKARALRIQRLRAMAEQKLENPMAALDALITELVAGESHPDLWEGIHGGALRDGKEQELATAYVKTVTGRRMGQLELRHQADVLVHAAEFHQGMLGDGATAENFLERVLHLVPGHREAFVRLERRFEKQPARLIELWALVASADPKQYDDLVTKAVNKLVPMPATSPISADACKHLVALAATHPVVIDVVEAHCSKTKRPELARTVLEHAIDALALPKKTVTDLRRRVVTLAIGPAPAPEVAMKHVEALLEDDPSDDVARGAAEKLLSTKSVAARAAGALQKARRFSRAPGRQSDRP